MLVDAAARVVVGIIYHLPPMSFTYNMAAAPSINVYDSSSLWRPTKGCSSLPIIDGRLKKPGKMGIPKGVVVFSAGPESPTITVTESKQAAPSEAEAEAAAPAAEKPKPKRAVAAKTPAKPLPHLMEEDVIPALRAILEAQQDLSQIQLSFQDNRLEGSFEKSGIPYYFWAFFPNGVLTGPKGFALSSHGSEASTVEPFLIDEKKITAKHVVFWVEKRLAAQGIIPVWQEL